MGSPWRRLAACLSLAGLLFSSGCQSGPVSDAATPASGGTATASLEPTAAATASPAPACLAPARADWLRWSPDGTALAYGLERSTVRRIYVIDDVPGAAGNPVTPRLVARDGWEFAWEPTGERLVYATASGRHLSLVDRDGRALETIDVGWQHGAPAWSPDGNTLAFAHSARLRDDAGLAESGLYLLSLDPGDAPRNVLSLASVAALGGVGSLRLQGRPAWSPDGGQLAVVAGDRLFVVDAAGGARAVSADGVCAAEPAWDPAGSGTLVWLGVPAGSEANAPYALRLEPGAAESTGGRAVTGAEGMAVTAFGFSPDGRRLAVLAGPERELGLVGLDGSGLVTLPATPDRVEVAIAWSPLGDQLAVVAGNRVELVAVDGGQRTTLAVIPSR